MAQQPTPKKKKDNFVRVKDESYEQIIQLAKLEDRSRNKMANILIKEALAARKRVAA